MTTRMGGMSVWFIMMIMGPIVAGATDLSLRPGLVVSVTTHAGLVSNAGSLAIADTETLYSVTAMRPDAVEFGFTIAAPNDQKAMDLMKKPLKFTRHVRREDLTSATRLNLSWGSDDPEIFPGQTFIQTSAAAITALRSKGESPFVLGINEGGLFSAAAAAPPAAAADSKDAGPIILSGLLSALGVERHYYRGVLKRVEPTTVPFSVLVNGVRTTLPAIHVRGLLKFGARERSAEFYWLDDPANALMLKWIVGRNYALMTRIDIPDPEPEMHHSGGMGGIDLTAGAVGHALASKSCRAELHGIYFATGSAELLPESTPTLKSLSALILANAAWTVTIEGHTDNIGSAEYNMLLSNRRAAAVRDALARNYRVPPTRISSKGLGLSKPVESNATDEGRARNRRVEIVRACGA